MSRPRMAHEPDPYRIADNVAKAEPVTDIRVRWAMRPGIGGFIGLCILALGASMYVGNALHEFIR